MAIVIASLAVAIAVPFGVGSLLLPGVPVAAVMGYVLASTVRPEGSNVGAAVKMSISTVLLADAVFVFGLTVGNLPDMGSVGTSPVTLFAGSVYFWFIGLLFYGLPALAFVTGPCAIVWVMVVTRLSPWAADNGAR
ncbi:MAG TPA: hypothetical protein VFO73_01080 [Candidatus Limnocylindrales bacterium]|nr:hypothetical protein [Candidatus Limnocylindrales bacterium]